VKTNSDCVEQVSSYPKLRGGLPELITPQVEILKWKQRPLYLKIKSQQKAKQKDQTENIFIKRWD
jgi:hypothetical protein